MTTMVIEAQWKPDRRREVAEAMFAELRMVQEYICDKSCPVEHHTQRCDRLRAVLLDAEPVLQNGATMIKQPEVQPPMPGSDEAILAGCECAVLDNHHGAGAYEVNGRPVFWVNGECPLHGNGKTDCTLKRLAADPDMYSGA
jgi:hypothetical protein